MKEEIEENGVKAEVEAGAIGYEMVQASKSIEGMTLANITSSLTYLGKMQTIMLKRPLKIL